MSVDRINSGPKNSLYARVNFEHSQGREAACALIDSSATENFIDKRMVEQWGLLWKKLLNPRPIVNVDGTENKAGAVTEACILNVLHKENLLQFSPCVVPHYLYLPLYDVLSVTFSKCQPQWHVTISTTYIKMDCLFHHSGSSYPT